MSKHRILQSAFNDGEREREKQQSKLMMVKKRPFSLLKLNEGPLAVFLLCVCVLLLCLYVRVKKTSFRASALLKISFFYRSRFGCTLHVLRSFPVYVNHTRVQKREHCRYCRQRQRANGTKHLKKEEERQILKKKTLKKRFLTQIRFTGERPVGQKVQTKRKKALKLQNNTLNSATASRETN